jgi:5-methylthioribose kinase
MLYPASLFEDQGHDSSIACEQLLADINTDAMAFCGIEMHRRCLSLAHNADFEDIESPTIRAPLEARNIEMGIQLILEADTVSDESLLISMAKSYNQRNIL